MGEDDGLDGKRLLIMGSVNPPIGQSYTWSATGLTRLAFTLIPV